MEYLLINDSTNITDFKKEIRWNEVYFHLMKR
jgi:L-arabinose isomerase